MPSVIALLIAGAAALDWANPGAEGALLDAVRIGVRGAGGLEVEVTDNGAAKAPGGSAGKGLKNMAGRALSIGGALTAGACDEGGWRVRLDLPGA